MQVRVLWGTVEVVGAIIARRRRRDIFQVANPDTLAGGHLSEFPRSGGRLQAANIAPKPGRLMGDGVQAAQMARFLARGSVAR